MTNGLKPRKMGGFLSVKHGYPFQSEHFASEGHYVVVTPGNFYEAGGFKRTPGKEKYFISQFPSEYLLKKGDLIVAMTQQTAGLLGSTAIIPTENEYLHNQRIGLISFDDTVVDKLYLYYLFMTRSVRKQIEDSASGTKIKHTSPDKIYDVVVYLPELDIQKCVGKLLWNLEQKSRNNSRITTELESMAKTLYDYWFVQFDFPDANGKPFRASGGEMVWNEQLKREIPKDWTLGSINDILTIDNTSIDPRKKGNIIMEHYSIPAYDTNQFPVYESAGTIESGKYAVAPECILTSKLNPHFKRLWDPFCETQNAICSTEFIVYRPRRVWTRPYCYAVLNSDEFYAHMVSNATSSTGSRKRIQPEVSASFKLAIAPDDVIKCFNAIYAPVMGRLKVLRKENQEFRQLRDWLLPMLMNGQATVESTDTVPHLREPMPEKPACDLRFDRWLQTQGVAARGNIDEQTLHDIFDAMDDDDKQ